MPPDLSSSPFVLFLPFVFLWFLHTHLFLIYSFISSLLPFSLLVINFPCFFSIYLSVLPFFHILSFLHPRLLPPIPCLRSFTLFYLSLPLLFLFSVSLLTLSIFLSLPSVLCSFSSYSSSPPYFFLPIPSLRSVFNLFMLP